MLLSAGLTALSCQDPKGTASHSEVAHAESAGTEGRRVKVDAGLVSQGRIGLAKVKEISLAEGMALQGTVNPAPDAEAIVGGMVNGRVRELLAEEGQRVKKGEILAWLDSPEVGQARADVLRAQAMQELGQRSLDRERKLLEERAGTQSRLENAQAVAHGARAELSAAEARVRALGAGSGQGGLVPLRAPIDGIVVERIPKLGEAVSASDHLFRLLDPTRLQVRSFAPPLVATGLTEGAPLRVRARLLGKPEPSECSATLTFRLDSVDAATRSVPLLLKPASDCEFLKVGLTVEVLAPFEGSAADPGQGNPFEVPIESVTELRGDKVVFAARGAPGEFEAVSVEPIVTRTETILVRGALEPGESVVRAGTLLIKGELLRELLDGH